MFDVRSRARVCVYLFSLSFATRTERNRWWRVIVCIFLVEEKWNSICNDDANAAKARKKITEIDFNWNGLTRWQQTISFRWRNPNTHSRTIWFRFSFLCIFFRSRSFDLHKLSCSYNVHVLTTDHSVITVNRIADSNGTFTMRTVWTAWRKCQTSGDSTILIEWKTYDEIPSWSLFGVSAGETHPRGINLKYWYFTHKKCSTIRQTKVSLLCLYRAASRIC